MRALSRKKASRESLLRNLATSLVLYERIETTEAKAKEVKPVVEHLIALAKKNDLAARRRLLGYFFDKNATKKVLEVLVPRFANLQSGFIKSYRKGVRLGDGAMIMILELRKSEIKEEIKELNTEGKDGTEKHAKATKPADKEVGAKGNAANNSKRTKANTAK
ncbi:TPA: 50S ribosomal protein L17 [Candidatus Berkelbacteria bacterium]|uniref:50S ribosomal protein L17 n=1 Tax=Berkelbacteria bacterium GW2011_GWE1_39_12 TaxID=1618337 RepID=A0A0G4B4K5_9BACT|nr:MAG: 50S ribosomal protein L17, large subunit ribosomal protein L17 [Berkelbacteria bacterium GW2011_GWE1_39_12]HBO60170.1 50S ribosomal protein L17 [Candidatus Berkelbacteria bacterium]